MEQEDVWQISRTEEPDMEQWTGCKSGKEYITGNAGLEEAEIKIAGRNINKISYEDDTTLMAESKEELKSLMMRVKKLA